MAFLYQFFHRSKNTEQAGFGIHGSPAPEVSVSVNITAEGFMIPFTVGFHNIMMAHEEDGIRLSPAAPFKKQAAVEFMLLTGFMYQRKQFLQDFVKFIKFCLIGIKPAGYRFLPDHFCQSFSVSSCSFVFLKLHLSRHGRCGLQHTGSHYNCCRKQKYKNYNCQDYIACHI